jgi:sulfur carrier protein ThiS
MQIRLCLYGVFRHNRSAEALRELPAGTRVAAVVESLALPDHLLGIILVNGLHAGLETVLQEGDCLSLLPMVDGG